MGDVKEGHVCDLAAQNVLHLDSSVLSDSFANQLLLCKCAQIFHHTPFSDCKQWIFFIRWQQRSFEAQLVARLERLDFHGVYVDLLEYVRAKLMQNFQSVRSKDSQTEFRLLFMRV